MNLYRKVVMDLVNRQEFANVTFPVDTPIELVAAVPVKDRVDKVTIHFHPNGAIRHIDGVKVTAAEGNTPAVRFTDAAIQVMFGVLRK